MGRTITMWTNPLVGVDEGSDTYVVPESPWDVVLAPNDALAPLRLRTGGGLDASLAQGTGAGPVRSIVVVMNMAVQQASRAGTTGRRTMTWIETLAPSRGSRLGSL